MRLLAEDGTMTAAPAADEAETSGETAPADKADTTDKATPTGSLASKRTKKAATPNNEPPAQGSLF